ncbi:hypothetical protein F2P56_014816 [Juglans regia]|uniref:Uncharacterized protein n=1 Tax=Juglans regia TaxID=51240 RepID=A0A833XER1_JUGRE|nr:hypothetical protein F2P56_014816 [Juglans regia]
MEGADDGGIERVVDSKDLQQQSKAFDKLTDRVEDRQLDSTRVQEAMASIATSAEADWKATKMSKQSFIDHKNRQEPKYKGHIQEHHLCVLKVVAFLMLL